MTATPRPWFHTEGDVWADTREQVCCGRGTFECCGEPDVIGGQELIAKTGTHDAALIVRAVNNHDKLVEALERLCLVQEGVPMSGILASQYLDQARVALKLAKGEA